MEDELNVKGHGEPLLREGSFEFHCFHLRLMAIRTLDPRVNIVDVYVGTLLIASSMLALAWAWAGEKYYIIFRKVYVINCRMSKSFSAFLSTNLFP